ncbi:DUF885 family protein [Xanthomonas sp. NCPPB 1638]|uniref:DUF885 domain-containing protein n=1 Tax=Xanthomonas TaxID=338 RepID=UPI00132E8130|nr:DUF885 family protein [Xanthomonas cucurbitae]QHG87214.1 DUF885 family protein [Xanthomonas cucurbitae]WDM77140.1 DUF885 family protein [Xanthomonas cucurbitae]
MSHLRSVAIGLLAAAVFTACKPAPPAPEKPAAAASSEQAAKAFDALLDKQWQYQLQHNPEFASIIGDKRYNDRWTNYSPEAVQADRRATAALLRQFEAVDAKALDAQRQLSLQMMLGQLRDKLEGIDLKTYAMPLEPVGGIQLALAGYGDAFPFENAKDYQDYITRLQAIPGVIDQIIAVSRQGAKDGLVQPRYLLQRLPEQIDKMAALTGEQSPFASPLKKLAAAVPADQRDAVRKQLLAAIDQQVRPAYGKLSAFVRDEYAAQGRRSEGLWSLPDGERRYRYAIHTQTTTDMAPEQIHQIGLREVARIEGEMAVIAQAQGFADLSSFRKAVETDRRHFATSGEQILQHYRQYIAAMEPELPRLFGHLPKTPLEVQAMPAFRRTAPSAEYWQSNPEGSKPAIVKVNTSDFASRTLVNIETTAYHEGVPGHHLQISLAQTLPLPPFRQQAGYNAYIEGWALYAERLGKEIGFFKDPYNDYGRLSGELLRANRLVLDTGVHYKRWNRQQMVDFFHAHPSDDEPSIQSETDRYIVWPGQALGYKLGELQILALRAQAEKALGDHFDVRAFHDAVLGGGAMPLGMLQQRVQQWIAQAKTIPGAVK